MIKDCLAVVWVADGRIAPGLDYGVRLTEQLESNGYRVVRRDLTSDTGSVVPAAALHVLSGGGTSVGVPGGWMPDALQLTRKLVADAQRGNHSVLGVCLGSQMIAASQWSGAVSQADRMEVGLAEIGWRVGRGAQHRMVVPEFHYEVVDRHAVCAGDGQVIADNGWGGLEGFQLGPRVLGVQFHPELTVADLHALVSYHHETIEAHGGNTSAVLETVDALKSRWTPRVFAEVLDLVTRPA